MYPPLPQVHTKLAHPTNYHVSAIQKRQVSQFLSSQGPHYTSHSAPAQHNTPFARGGMPGLGGNMTSFSVRKDPMLSGLPSASPQQRSPVGTFDGGQLNVGGSPNHPGMLMTGSPSHSGLFVGQPPQNLVLKPESPTMMATETPENVSDISCGLPWQPLFWNVNHVHHVVCVCVCRSRTRSLRTLWVWRRSLGRHWEACLSWTPLSLHPRRWAVIKVRGYS